MRKSLLILPVLLMLCGLPILVAMAAPPGSTVVGVAMAINSEGPSGHFMRRGENSPFVSKFLR